MEVTHVNIFFREKVEEARYRDNIFKQICLLRRQREIFCGSLIHGFISSLEHSRPFFLCRRPRKKNLSEDHNKSIWLAETVLRLLTQSRSSRKNNGGGKRLCFFISFTFSPSFLQKNTNESTFLSIFHFHKRNQ